MNYFKCFADFERFADNKKFKEVKFMTTSSYAVVVSQLGNTFRFKYYEFDTMNPITPPPIILYDWIQKTNSTSGYFSEVRFSGNGEVAAALHVEYPGSTPVYSVFVSKNSGETWTKTYQTDIENYWDVNYVNPDDWIGWSNLTLSYTGEIILVALNDNSRMLQSSNFGDTWIKRDIIPYNVLSIEISRNNSVILFGGSGNGNLYMGDISNIQPVISLGEHENYRDIKVSHDSTVIMVETNLTVYISTDSGLTWGQRFNTSGESLRSMEMSSDGSIMMIGTHSYPYTSFDYGVTWNQFINIGSPNIRITPDGSFIILFDGYNKIYTSIDYGVSFNEVIHNFANIYDIRISDNGNSIILQDFNVNMLLYISKDFGATWVQIEAQEFLYNDKIYSVSSTGNKLTSAGYIDNSMQNNIYVKNL